MTTKQLLSVHSMQNPDLLTIKHLLSVYHMQNIELDKTKGERR